MSRIYVGFGEPTPGGFDISLSLGEHIYTGSEKFDRIYGSPTSLEADVLNIASTVFAIDRGIPRGEREDFARRIELSVPIVNVAKLQPLLGDIEKVLRSLTNDSWRITVRQHPGSPETHFSRPATDGQTLLFSGGLDSLAAAVEFGKATALQLVSHVTRNQEPQNTQQELVRLLRKSGIDRPHHQFFVSSRDAQNFDHDIENTQRTRSFLFLVLGALVARREGHRKVLVIAENGQMAIHLPLNQARIGAFSTHTAHPDVLASMQSILRSALTASFAIVNPYVNKTKAEVLRIVWEQLREAIEIANSCWKNTRLPNDATHCGQCIPCYIRRIAIETHGLDKTAYARNTFAENIGSLPPTDDARRNLVDLCEFVVRFQKESDLELMSDWPELYSTNIDAAATIRMYRRASNSPWCN